MTYYLVHDTEPGDSVPYYIMDTDATKWTGWESTIQDCFSNMYHYEGLNHPDIFDPDLELIVHIIELDEFTYEEFAHKYPEFLV